MADHIEEETESTRGGCREVASLRKGDSHAVHKWQYDRPKQTTHMASLLHGLAMCSTLQNYMDWPCVPPYKTTWTSHDFYLTRLHVLAMRSTLQDYMD